MGDCQWHGMVSLPYFRWVASDWLVQFEWWAVGYHQRRWRSKMHESLLNQQHSALNTHSSQHLPFVRHEFAAFLDWSHEYGRKCYQETSAFASLHEPKQTTTNVNYCMNKWNSDKRITNLPLMPLPIDILLLSSLKIKWRPINSSFECWWDMKCENLLSPKHRWQWISFGLAIERCNSIQSHFLVLWLNTEDWWSWKIKFKLNNYHIRQTMDC